jgi:hypothetical protein
VTTRADELVAAYRRLATALACERHHVELVRDLAICCGWGSRSTLDPLLPSGIRHGVPWGLSTAPGSRELRVFVEAQADPPTLASYRSSARSVCAFAERHGATLERLDTMLAGLDPDGLRLWHAVTLTTGSAPAWHAYACMPPGDRSVPLAALRAAGIVEPNLRLRAVDRISIVSLDLAEPARVKAYVLMPDASLEDVAALIEGAGLSPHGAIAFGRAMLGDSDPSVPVFAAAEEREVTEPSAPAMTAWRMEAGQAVDGGTTASGISRREAARERSRLDGVRTEARFDLATRRIWWLVALGFRPGQREAVSAALHFGVPRHVDEATARERIGRLLAALELDVEAWRRATEALGAHHFVTFQHRHGKPRITTYFVPEVAR